MPHHRLEPRALSPIVSAHLDFIRSMAAWTVMWGHLRAFFFLDFQDLRHPTLFLKGLYVLTGFGHQAVMVFFVLSGFLISSSILRGQASKTWSWAGYAISRATRLYVVLIPGLLFGTLWDLLGMHLFAFTGLYTLPLASFGGLIVQNELSLRNLFGNLFFLQTILCDTYGSNGPLWSIANEFWYYLLFPLGLLASYAWIRKKVGVATTFTASALCISLILGPDKIVGFFIWMAGFFVMVVWSRIQISKLGSRVFYLLLSSVVLIASLAAARSGRLTPRISDLAVGLAFSAFLFGVLQAEIQVTATGTYLRGAHLFAGFSYTLYVLHFPFLLFLRAWFVPSGRWQPDGIHLLYAAGIGVITLAFSWFLAMFTEHKTSDVRRRLMRLLNVSGKTSGS